jgi:tetratricopeptide (TPR) repeat protein
LLAQNHVGLIHYYAGDYGEAQRWHEAILRESPEFAQAHWDLGRVYLAREQFDEAHAALSRAVEISGGKPLFLGTLGFCEAAMGNRASAKKLAANLVKLSETIYVSPLAGC